MKTKREKPLSFDEWLQAYKGYEYMYFRGLKQKQREIIKQEYGYYRKNHAKGIIKNYEI